MSHASAKPHTATPQPSLGDLFGFRLTLVLTSLENLRNVLQAPSFPAPDLTFLRPKDPCAIPEIDCPPRCVCDVTWEASPGETPGLTVRVTNTSSSARTFQFQATPFTGPSGSPGTLALAPPTLTLQPGQTGVVNAKFTVPNVPEDDYHAEILIKGAYEQCVRVRLRVRCRKTAGDEHCTCDVLQGDPPVRIRAHHWYHHFQCVEPCGDDRQRSDHHG
jgi:hypothetical protein